jgi:signal transduction histidine kinase
VPELLSRIGRVGSLRVRITVLATVITAVAVVLSGWLLLRSVESTQAAELQRAAERGVDLAVDRLAGGDRYEEALLDLPAVVVVTDDDGRCVTSLPAGDDLTVQCVDGGTRATGGTGSPAGSGGPSISGSGPADTGMGVDAVGPGVVVSSTGTPKTVTRQVDSPTYGRLAVTSMTPSDEVARSVASVRGALWWVLPALVAVVGIVTWLLLGRTLQPVESIRREAEAIGGSSIHRRLPEPDTDDEIGRLARTMNRMLDRLEGSARRQHQFVSDASHELRTPVTAIRTDLEVALSEGDDAEWEAVARAVLGENARLEAVIGDLLVLATEDEAGSADGTAPAAVGLDALVVEEAARTRRVPVTADLDPDPSPEGFVVTGSASRLQLVIANLLDNACRHAASQVAVRLSSSPRHVRIDVDDDGPGVAEGDRDRIFERFTRLDDSRARDQGGTGLGLAVVRSVLTRHDGTVTVTAAPLGGARFTVELPRAGEL